jgi:hypothetical protein
MLELPITPHCNMFIVEVTDKPFLLLCRPQLSTTNQGRVEDHRYLKRKIDSLRFVMCLLLVPVFQGFFFAAAIKSTNETNKAGGMCH